MCLITVLRLYALGNIYITFKFEFCILGTLCGKKKLSSSGSGSTTSRVSTRRMQLLVESLLSQQTRKSTIQTYCRIWHKFNQFLLSLDVLPKTWEQCTTLYIAFLIDEGKQSSSVKTYVSAIKKLVMLDGYKWRDEEVLLTSLTKACRIINGKVHTQLPVHYKLLELVLFELPRLFKTEQQYLVILYRALFAFSYYGMLRVGEVCQGPYVLKAKDVHVAWNKNKILAILYSSKTHGAKSRPQHIKISSTCEARQGVQSHNFCPFNLLRTYLRVHGDFLKENEQFFVFSGRIPVTLVQVNSMLKAAITSLGLNEAIYSFHSLRIGRTSDLIKDGCTIEHVKCLGCWKSNAVFRYIRQ